MEYDNYLVEMYKKLINISKASWQGTDANNFIESSINTVNELNSESEFLATWNEYLSKSSDIYSSKFNESYARFQSIESSFDGNK